MRIEYKYSGEERQIIEGQNLTHTIEEIPPPFTGGQMAGVRYRIELVRYEPELDQYSYSQANLRPLAPIKSLQIKNTCTGVVATTFKYENTHYFGLRILVEDAESTYETTTPYAQNCGRIGGGSYYSLRVRTLDGSPDTGGNLPSTYKFTVYENGIEIYTSTRSQIPLIATIVVDYLKFAEERLELGIDYNAVGGMRFSTTIIETENGGQQRNANWWLPLGRWQLGERTLLESQQDKLAEVTYLKEFHAARKGSFEGFRFKDWSDYQIINQEIGISDGVETEYQLKKTYYAGAASCARPITKPVEGTVRIFVGYAEQLTGWSIDHTSGLIRFDNPPPISAVIQVTCEFDVPVWFESDAIGWRLEGYQDGEAIYRLESVFVEEGRIPVPKPHKIEPLPDLSNQILDLGIIYDTVETIEYQTSKQKLPSGYVRRDDNYPAPITKINLGDRILDKEELDRLLGFFWCAKGRNSSFWLKLKDENYYLNFAQDQLSLKFEAYENGVTPNSVSLFNLTGLSFNQNPAFAFLLTISNDHPTYYGFSAASGAFGENHQIIEASLNGIIFIGNEPSLIPKQLNGSATYIDNSVRLNNTANSAGSVFVLSALSLFDLFSLNLYFHYLIDGGSSNRNSVADGFAFLIQASASGTTTLTPGGGIGYAGTSNSVIVEFDTYLNQGADPDNNHVAITINGAIFTDPNYTVNPGFDIRGDRYCWITYAGGNLHVYLSETNTLPANPIVSRPIDWLEILS